MARSTLGIPLTGFTFWVGFVEHTFCRYKAGSAIERVSRDAWKGFIVLARLKDNYGRHVLTTEASQVVYTKNTIASVCWCFARAFLRDQLNTAEISTMLLN